MAIMNAVSERTGAGRWERMLYLESISDWTDTDIDVKALFQLITINKSVWGTKLQPILLYCTCRGNFGKDRCEQLMDSTIHFQKMLHWENSLVLIRWKAKGTESRLSTFLMPHGIALHLLQNMSEDGQWFTTSFLTYGNICICVQFPSYFISETNSLKWSK